MVCTDEALAVKLILFFICPQLINLWFYGLPPSPTPLYSLSWRRNFTYGISHHGLASNVI